MVTNFYRNLFADNDPYVLFVLIGAYPRLAESDLIDLNREVNMEEIFQIIKSIGGFKAPDLDGIQAIFYQKQWRVVGKDFFELIFNVFQDPSRVGELNDTLLALILKEDSVTNMKQF